MILSIISLLVGFFVIFFLILLKFFRNIFYNICVYCNYVKYIVLIGEKIIYIDKMFVVLFFFNIFICLILCILNYCLYIMNISKGFNIGD